MTNVSVRVAHTERAFADVLGFEVAHAGPERVGVGSIVVVNHRVQAARHRQDLERVTEEVGAVEHLARAVVEVEQHDDVGRVAHDRPEPFFGCSQLRRDHPLLLESLVEETVLVAEMADGRASPSDDDAGGEREQRQCDAGEEHQGAGARSRTDPVPCP